jgi:putative molybdopterin biosynthesis protein
MVHLSIEYKFTDQPTRNRLEHPLLEVLESVHETGSIAQAAKNLQRSFRYVWSELKHWESVLDTDLIVWGRTGKGAELTPQALRFLSAMSKSHVDLEQQVALIKTRMAKCISLLRKTPRKQSFKK